MLGVLFVYPLFVATCVAALVRPYWGVLGFYTFVFLEPKWNWRWSIDGDIRFQLYIAACLLVGFLLSGMRGNTLNGWFKATVFSLLLFIGIAFLSASQTVYMDVSRKYLDNLWKIILVALIAMRVINTPRKAWIMLWLIVIMQGYNALRINEQYFIDGYSLYARRAWGVKGDNNLYSIFTVPAMAAAVGLFVHSSNVKQKSAAAFIFVLQAHELMLLESRGTMIGGIVLAATAFFLMPKTLITMRWVLAGVIVICGLAGPSVVNEFTSAFVAEEERDSSASSRFAVWKAGAIITAEHPLLGVGPYAGQMLVPMYADEHMADGYDRKGLHNLIFEISTGCGIPAAILYMLFFLIPWWIAWRIYRHRKTTLPPETAACCLALACGIPGYLAASMFSSGALLESPYILIATCAGGIYSWQQANRVNHSGTQPRTTTAAV